ncbi:hypothetical protein MP228_007657 [Amoeboaphelidium protococcarum]|nr:hypothetical protein MP228_007657 [Amoeboaphelidium protococcarum]
MFKHVITKIDALKILDSNQLIQGMIDSLDLLLMFSFDNNNLSSYMKKSNAVLSSEDQSASNFRTAFKYDQSFKYKEFQTINVANMSGGKPFKVGRINRLPEANIPPNPAYVANVPRASIYTDLYSVSTPHDTGFREELEKRKPQIQAPGVQLTRNVEKQSGYKPFAQPAVRIPP